MKISRFPLLKKTKQCKGKRLNITTVSSSAQTLVAAVLLLVGVLQGAIQGAQSSPARLDDEYQAHSDEDDDRRPYSFAWEASRHYHGLPDREHREERGPDGITRGVYRWGAGSVAREAAEGVEAGWNSPWWGWQCYL